MFLRVLFLLITYVYAFRILTIMYINFFLLYEEEKVIQFVATVFFVTSSSDKQTLILFA